MEGLFQTSRPGLSGVLSPAGLLVFGGKAEIEKQSSCERGGNLKHVKSLCSVTSTGQIVPADPVSWAFEFPKLVGHPCETGRVFGKRTKLQGNAWWGIVVPIYQKCVGHLNKDFAHYELVKEIAPFVTLDIKGREHIGPTPTNDMDTVQSLSLYKKAQDFIGSEYGIPVPDPDPAWKGFKA